MDSKREITRVTKTASTKSFLSRTFTKSGLESNDESHTSKGPLGLTTLHDPGSGQSAIADIIFVHGLNGGSQSTWSKGNDETNFWPKTWLPMDNAFHDVRVHSFGYSSGLSRESILNVRDFASSLLAAIKDSPVMNRGDKVFFLTMPGYAPHTTLRPRISKIISTNVDTISTLALSHFCRA